jgi:transcriptional regulator with XRE-family HTH domain
MGRRFHMPPTNIAIRQFRKTQGQTQSELARALGVPQSTISRWEQGINLPGPGHAAKLARLKGGLHARTAGFLIDSSFLPGDFHDDPADRIIVATARAFDLTVVTRDRAILAYARQGYVLALPC